MNKICSDCCDNLDYPSEKRRNICKTCNRIRTALWQRNNKDKVAKKARRRSLKKYDITEDIYKIMLIEQNHVCKICKKDNKNKKNLSVDHCHKTGKVRSLLCNKCNTILGLANDNLDVLKNAIKYIKNFIIVHNSKK